MHTQKDTISIILKLANEMSYRDMYELFSNSAHMVFRIIKTGETAIFDGDISLDGEYCIVARIILPAVDRWQLACNVCYYNEKFYAITKNIDAYKMIELNLRVN